MRQIKFTSVADSLDHGPVGVDTDLAWDPADPAKLTFTFTGTDDVAQPWVMGRDLVIRALALPGEHGEGDVSAASSAQFFMLVLNGHDEGIASIRLPRVIVEAFVAATVQHISPLDEGAVYAASLDAELAHLLGGAA